MTEPNGTEGEATPETPLQSEAHTDATQHPAAEPTQAQAYPAQQQAYDPNLPPLNPMYEQAQLGGTPGYGQQQQQQYAPDYQQQAYPPPEYQQGQVPQYPQQPQHPQNPQQAPQQPQQQAPQQPYAPQPPPPLPQPQRNKHALGSNDELTGSSVRSARRKPQSGWRKAVYVGTGKLVNPGESPVDRRRRELSARVAQPLRGCYKIAMLSLKGGVGKTTTTTTLGSTFASRRGDRVIAVDANPDRGTLAQKIPLETTATVRHLLRDADRISRYSDVRAYTSQGPSRLEILASEQDPAVSEAFSEFDYRRTIDLLEHFYNIVLTDCGTGLMHSAMKGVLDVADALVIVSSGSVDGARSASATLDWLDAHGYGDLVARSVTAINSVRPKAGSVDLNKLSAHFGARTRGVVRIPFDPHLEEGAEVDLDRLHPDTTLALLELAALVADGFAGQHQ